MIGRTRQERRTYLIKVSSQSLETGNRRYDSTDPPGETYIPHQGLLTEPGDWYQEIYSTDPPGETYIPHQGLLTEPGDWYRRYDSTDPPGETYIPHQGLHTEPGDWYQEI